MGHPERYLQITPEWDAAGTPLIRFTEDEEANRLLAEDPNAFLIGVVLDQQIKTEKAFAGPAELRRRLGHLDPAKIAEMDQDEFLEIFRDKPAIHRFPASMGKRVQDACRTLVEDWQGDASAIWQDAPDAKTAMKRLSRLPGVGKAKQQLMVMLLGRYYGVELAGWQEASPVEIPR